MSVHKNNQIIGEARVFHGGVASTDRGGIRSFQHPIHLGRVDVDEQRGDHPELRNPLPARCLEDRSQQAHDVRVLNSERNLGEQQVMPHGVKVGTQIQIDHVCLVLDDRLRNAVHRFIRCPLWSIPI